MTGSNPTHHRVRRVLADGLSDRTLSRLHPLLLVAAAFLLGAGCFSQALWFDEAYTAGLMTHSFADMIRYSASDVHPHLYYILLWLFTRVFGASVPVMRLFSAIGGLLFVSVGYTHIRRDFGARMGFWFSFVAAVLAPTLTYSLQVRMYTFAMYFVALTAVYACRLSRGQASVSNRVLFVLCSVAAAYTHYFALFTVAVINVMLLVRTVRLHRPLRSWLIPAAVQIGAYLPGAYVLLRQASAGGGWQSVRWPEIVFEFVSYPFLGDELSHYLEAGSTSYKLAGFLFLGLFVLFLVLLHRAIRRAATPVSTPVGEDSLTASDGSAVTDEDGQAALSRSGDAAKWSVMAYLGVVLFSLTVSLWRVIYYIRYTVVPFAFFVFALAFLICSVRRGWVRILAGVLLILMLIFPAVDLFSTYYDPSSTAAEEYLDGQIREGDVLVFDEASMYALSVRYPEYESYFYNKGHWGVQEAYRAFGPKAHILDEISCPEINGYTGRIWVLGRGEAYSYLMSLGDCREVSAETVYQRYHGYTYEIILIEKGME